jgi:hypothetical protein
MGEDAGAHRPPLCHGRRIGGHSVADGDTVAAHHTGVGAGGEGPDVVGPAGGIGIGGTQPSGGG